MKTILIFIFLSIHILISAYAQNPIIITSDIDHFWEAFDALSRAKSKSDSVQIIQELYLDRASRGLELFIKARDLTADKYVFQISKAPEFWKSIRPNTLKIQHHIPEIKSQYVLFRQSLKGFKDPAICFAIGILSTGGTVKNSWLLIGSEMVAADSSSYKQELNPWLQFVLPEQPQILEFTAHEIVHTQQRAGLGAVWGYFNHRLLTMTINEGAAEFLAEKITGTKINQAMYNYAYAHEKELWEEFSQEMYGKNYQKWLYNGTGAKDRPADLGYFIGYRICESYYNQAKNKEKALNKILKTNSYRRFLKKSGYGENFSADNVKN